MVINYEKLAEIEKLFLDSGDKSCYITATFIANKVKISKQDLYNFSRISNVFKRSLIITEKDDDVYYKNHSFAWLLDIWRTFQYICHLKY